MPKKQLAKADKANKAKKLSDVDTLEKVLKDFQSCWKYCEGSWHDRWTNNYKLYHNERVKIGYQGITQTFVPMVFSTIETMTSALFGAKPKFNYLAPRNKQDQKTDILNALVDYYWDKDQWSIKVINTGRGMLMRGVGVDYFYWCGDHPAMLNIPLRDFIFDPTASSLETMRYMGRRYLTTIDELKSFEIVDLDADADEDGDHPMKKKYTNLDMIDESTVAPANGKKGAHTGQEKTDKEDKDMFYGSTLDGDDTGQVEVLEIWYEDRVYSIMNRKVIIENEENYFKAKAKANGDKYPKGLMPFAAARDYTDESLFLATSEIDVIADEQELLNDITNQNIDSVTYTLNQMYTLDPKYGDQIQTVENLPGAVYPFEAGALNPIPQRSVPPEAFAERMNIKNEIREATASNEVVKGVGEQGGKSTATEINAQIAGAGQRINLKVTQIENEYFHRMARIVFQMIRLYVTEPMMVRIVGKDGAKWEEFDPSEYSDGDYEPRVQLDIAIQNQKAQAGAEAKEMMAAFLNDQDVNQVELKKLVLAKGFQLDPDEVALLMTPNPALEPEPPMDPMAGMMPEAMPMQDPMMGGMPPMDPMMMPEEDMMLPPPMPELSGEMVQDPVSGEMIPIELVEMMA